MHVGSLTVELRLGTPHSLKEKRSVVRPIVDGARRRFSVAAAEVDHQDAWQHSTLAFAAVSSSVHHVGRMLDSVERFVWSFPEVEVVATRRGWMSDEDD
jgi:uncharacterized protein